MKRCVKYSPKKIFYSPVSELRHNTFGTSNNTKATLKCIYALAWTVSQGTDTNKNTLTCCYALHADVGTVFSYDKLLV